MYDEAGELDVEVRSAYLARLGVEVTPPSVEALRLLVARQVERVPYETLWIAAGDRWSTDPAQAARRIAFERRGGYCYHLNGAFGLLLRSLGFAVHAHVGGVQAGEPNPHAMGNHLVLTVTGLPTEENPTGSWYVDVGLGDALHGPLPLEAGTYVDGPFRVSLEREDGQRWRLVHDPAGGFRSMTWTASRASGDDFVAQHEWLSTSPESGFVQVPMAERRDATGVDVVRGLTRSRIGSGAFTGTPITRQAEWFDLVENLFDLPVHALPAEARERVWARVTEAHRVWEASRD